MKGLTALRDTVLSHKDGHRGSNILWSGIRGVFIFFLFCYSASLYRYTRTFRSYPTIFVPCLQGLILLLLPFAYLLDLARFVSLNFVARLVVKGLSCFCVLPDVRIHSFIHSSCSINFVSLLNISMYRWPYVKYQQYQATKALERVSRVLRQHEQTSSRNTERSSSEGRRRLSNNRTYTDSNEAVVDFGG